MISLSVVIGDAAGGGIRAAPPGRHSRGLRLQLAKQVREVPHQARACRPARPQRQAATIWAAGTIIHRTAGELTESSNSRSIPARSPTQQETAT
jgi:hypothetical protein